MPRVPLPDVGVTFTRETCPASSEDITPRSSLLQTHASIPSGSPLLRLLASFEESLQVATSPCCHRDSSRRYSANPSPDARAHAPAVSLSAFAWFFLSVHRPSPSFDWVGFPLPSVEHDFSRVGFRGCSYFIMFRPPSLLASQIVPTAASSPAGQPRLLHPSRTCVVTFARIGHAIRPTTGNWRNENFHLARFAALSAATE